MFCDEDVELELSSVTEFDETKARNAKINSKIDGSDMNGFEVVVVYSFRRTASKCGDKCQPTPTNGDLIVRGVLDI